MFMEIPGSLIQYLQSHVMPTEIMIIHTRHDTPVIATRIITEQATQNNRMISQTKPIYISTYYKIHSSME